MKVDFHSGVTDKIGAACRFLRKAQDAGAAVVVCGDPATLDRLDVALWTFDPLAFVAHVRIRGNDDLPASAPPQAWLADNSCKAPSRDLLVNLGPDLAEGWETFARVVEIVSAEPADADAGRGRWRRYSKQAGLELIHHSRAMGT
jgi:DNA polymerase III subunit chi